jgi:hypothetical protein
VHDSVRVEVAECLTIDKIYFEQLCHIQSNVAESQSIG